MDNNGSLDKVIDKIFDMKKETIYLLIVLLLGVILRFIAAINLSVSADDMHFVTHAINFLSAERLITWGSSSGLWHAFTGLVYNFLGLTQLSSRIAALTFGSLTIISMYLLTKEFFNKKVALIAAFLLAIAPFHIKLTVAEMDAMAMFFSITGMFLFTRGIKENKNFLYIISGIFIGLSIYTKVYPMLFIPSLLLFFAYMRKKEKQPIFTKDNVKKISIFLIFIFIFTIPALTHNYLLYQDKGFMDIQFTRTLGLGKDISAQYYSWDAQFDAKNSWLGLILGDTAHVKSGTPLLLAAIGFIFFGDPMNFILGVGGLIIIFAFKKKYLNYVVFFILSILFALPFLASIILLPKHFLFLEILLIPMGSVAVLTIKDKLLKISGKYTLKLLIVALLIISLLALGYPNNNNMTHFYGKSHIAQVIDFKNEEIPENSLVVADSRIYRGRTNWAFQERPYLEGTDFISFLASQDQQPGEIIFIETYFVECVIDDCGWGTVKNQPEFNSSMEGLASLFKAEAELVKTIEEPNREKSFYPLISSENKIEIIRIYKGTFQFKESIMIPATQPKEWFLYTIGYIPKEKQFDYYDVNGAFNLLLNSIAHWIVLLSIVLTFLSIPYLFYLLLKE